MHQVLQALSVYRPFGQPAYGTIQCKTIPNSGDTVTIDGTVFTYGVDFSGATTPVRVAQALTAAIRSDVEFSYANNTAQPVRTFTAVYYNDTVFIFATAPGVAGNSIALATSNTSAFNLSGGTLSGGTNGSAVVTADSTPIPVALTDNSGTITTGGTAQTAAAANSSRRYLLVQNLSADVLWVNFGATATAGAGSIALLQYGSIEFNNASVPSGLVSVLAATTGDAFTIKQA